MRFVAAPDFVPNVLYEKPLFYRKLTELGINGVFTDMVMAALGEPFTLDELSRAAQRLAAPPRAAGRVRAGVAVDPHRWPR